MNEKLWITGAALWGLAGIAWAGSKIREVRERRAARLWEKRLRMRIVEEICAKKEGER